IRAAASRFVGRIDQRPPAFSALKIAGRRAYKLARAGQTPELAMRPIEIYSIEVEAYDYPQLILEVACGSGTYIRSLGRDLAESLGTAAVMSALVRTAIGSFRIEDAVEPQQLTTENWLGLIQPPLRAIELLPRMQLSADDARRIRNGLPINVGQVVNLASESWQVDNLPHKEIAAIGPDGQLVAILTCGDPGQLRVLRGLPAD
ncbi:MAG: hypothetical protein LLG00_07755, partial [Planctomycetaceae bacterium]|nr:hypothetical protein [Planctomycetaceae bacterium]